MRLLLLITVLAATDAARLERGERLLAARDCEGLQELFAPTAPARPEKDLDAARLLVRGATACREQDRVLAFALTQRALALAPDDYGVRTAHAESLLAVDERTAAARLLDELLQAHPQDAMRARFLRARLADQESESARVVKLVHPLLEDPEYATPARELLARNQAALEAQAKARQTLSQDEAALTERAREVAASRTHAPTRTAPRSGTEAWSTRTTLKSGGQRTFRTRNIQAGFTYTFHATGTCTGPENKKGRKSRLAPTVDLFGQDFRVRIGSLDPQPLKVGLEPERNALSFRPTENNPQIFIEDRSTQRPDGPRCTISDVAVRVP
jgi:tetratricopeptide (TPR) repeat protein